MSSANCRCSCINARSTSYLFSIWARYGFRVYTGPTFRFIHYYIVLRPFRHEQEPRQETVTDLERCILGKFLVVPSFVPRCFYVCKYAREPSGQKVELFVERLSCNFAEMTASSPFMYMFFCNKSATRDRRWHWGYFRSICSKHILR